ncbi:MAG: TetR family transcriptional regulator [Pseudomonadales bacterium RIFCSPLOWO2_12_59_9]|uniref:TetR/AcrR family transcriptional regulator n=1 Tax=Pseudomonas sp. TaxID=306 RepID=UPI0008AEBEB3|nr:MAG: TetR family transcriptional regulator [Pseudomonadales bacterium RIFCSPLOWO2_12_59_9]
MSEKIKKPSASQVASDVADSVQYQGRKAARQGSEQRRQAILDAAMRIIVRDGVRAVRHRAVASEAAVPLSATTYYFKDINDLITDTFALFVERSAAAMSAFWANAEQQLRQIEVGLGQDLESRRQLLEQIVDMAVAYVCAQLSGNRDSLLAEQALRLEALLNPGLLALANAHRKILYQGVDRFFLVLGSQQPDEDAKVLTGMILQMEYQGLLDGVDDLNLDEMRGLLRRYLRLVMGL